MSGIPTAPDETPLENPLSEREMDVARLLTTGATNSEIARELTISPHTVKVHLRNVFEKLQVSSRTEASMVLLQRGWVVVPGVEPASGPAVAEPAALPVLPPLHDQPAILATWQRVYLSIALALCLLAAVVPFVLSRPRTVFTLLSDAGQTVIGRPAVELLPRWEARTPLSQARSRMGIAMDNQLIYVVGGEGRGGRILATVESYDLAVNQWQPLAPLPVPLANSAAAIWSGGLYVAGGVTPAAPPANISANPTPDADTTLPAPATSDETTRAAPDDAAGASQTLSEGLAISESLLVYGGAFQTWRPLGALPVPLAGAQLLADDTALYLVGGWDGSGMRDEIWMWDMAESAPAANSAAQPPVEWRLLTRLPSPRAFFGAALVDDALYIAGGYDGENELADVHRYRLAGGEWQTLASLTIPRGGITLSHDGVALLALGGGWTRPVSDHERYDAVADQWTTFASPIPGEWRHLGAVSRDGVIHLVGGWSGDYLDTHFQYQSSFRALLPMLTND